ncbi:MAG: adenylosuccinate lyase [Bacteroidales bacterium]|nr:adenylosuccinate lyase [Bacteroidales bacterium]
MNNLDAISPIDGRYRSKTEPLAAYFSESALIRYRVRVEIEYYIALVGQLGVANLSAEMTEKLRDIYRNWSSESAQRVKDIEKTTNHDVKAVEYFIKEKFDCLEFGSTLPRELVHFGLTSQDINNTSFPMMIREAHLETVRPAYCELIEKIKALANEWRNIPMLAHTHGQPASPTALGKELMVFVYRLEEQLKALDNVPFSGKFGGATGNLNAHRVAYPDVDWRSFAKRFMKESLGLERQELTTQIENYDHLAAYLDGLRRMNTILIDFSRDIWTYISMNYFRQRIKAGEVGSSAMPHKVNPIDFENAEGNLGLADAILTHLAAKLPISRMQRDLTDSTVIRNLGVPLAHTLVALQSLMKGLGKLLLNEEKLRADLEDNWAVTAEAIQTILRSVNYPNPYEALKQLTRTNEKVTAQTMADFIDTLDVDNSVKDRLRAITPHNYLGYAEEW